MKGENNMNLDINIYDYISEEEIKEEIRGK